MSKPESNADKLARVQHWPNMVLKFSEEEREAVRFVLESRDRLLNAAKYSLDAWNFDALIAAIEFAEAAT